MGGRGYSPPLRAPRFLPERQTSPLLDGTRFPYRSSRGANPPRRTEGTEGARSERTFRRGSSFPGRRFLASVQEVPVSLTHRTCDYSLASDAADRSPSRIKLPYRFAARVLERILRWKSRTQTFVVVVSVSIPGTASRIIWFPGGVPQLVGGTR